MTEFKENNEKDVQITIETKETVTNRELSKTKIQLRLWFKPNIYAKSILF
jgi:hypothetical protein